MNKVKLKITAISPMVIASGEEFSLFEGFIDDKFLYLFDVEKIFATEAANDFKKIIDQQWENQTVRFEVFNRFYQENFDRIKSALVEQIPLDEKISEVNFQALKIKKTIRYYDIEKNQYLHYIPGSSLKGAFTSLLADYYPNLFGNKYNYGEQAKYIAFEDFYFDNYQNKIYRFARYNPKKNNFQVKIYCEAIVPNSVAFGYFYMPARKEVFNRKEVDFEKIFNLGGEYYRRKNARFYPKFSAELKEILTSEKNCLILPLGFGSRSFEKYGKKGNTYYTFRNYDPIGVVKIEMI
jgi:hypothetical protein